VQSSPAIVDDPLRRRTSFFAEHLEDHHRVEVDVVHDAPALAAVGNPQLDIGNIETVLETLYDTCYYIEAKGNQYRFTLKENLNKTNKQISLLLKRDPKTTWITYKSVEKTKPLSIKETKTQIPLSIFEDRRLSILEALVHFLKNLDMK